MKHIYLTLLLIIGLGFSASANDRPFAVGDVFFCEMEKNISWEWGTKETTDLELVKFKFSVSDYETISFGSSNFLNNLAMEATGKTLNTLEGASNFIGDTFTFILTKNLFNFTRIKPTSIQLVAATCDRF